MAEVRAVAKDRVALTILGLLKSNFAVERPSSSFLVLIASEHVTLGLEGVAVPKSLVFGKFLSIFDRFLSHCSQYFLKALCRFFTRTSLKSLTVKDRHLALRGPFGY